MSVITAVPWHVYLTLVAFSATIAVLVAIELHDHREAAPSGRDLRLYWPQRNHG